MTFEEWLVDHDGKVQEVLGRLNSTDPNVIIEYFDYDNMAEKESDFCPLYNMGEKCHDTNKLNCYYCACPYFMESDDEPFGYNGDVKIMSTCSINSTKAGTFIQDGVQQCDCTNCHVPHNARFALKYLKEQK